MKAKMKKVMIVAIICLVPIVSVSPVSASASAQDLCGGPCL